MFSQIVNQIVKNRNSFGILFGVVLYSQIQGQDYRGRVGINTVEPKATLDILEKNNLPEDHAQGVSFPNFTTDKREKFRNVEPGTIIYNTEKQCLEICVSSSGGVCEWQCMVSKVSVLAVTLSDVEVYIPSLSHSSGDYQGMIDNRSNKIKIKISYRDGVRSYDEMSIFS